jgi:hypothetical protein
MNRICAQLCITAMVIVGMAPFCTFSTLASQITPQLEPDSSGLAATAVQAYIYGYPLVLMEFTKVSVHLQTRTRDNQFYNVLKPIDPNEKTVVRPNLDTLYSLAFLQLRKGPVVLHVPDTNGRYYLMQIMDAWSNSLMSVGALTTGTLEREFLIAGPNWKGTPPAGMTVISSPTNLVWVVGRTKVTDTPEDIAEVNAIQVQYTLTPLSKHGKSHHSERSVFGPSLPSFLFSPLEGFPLLSQNRSIPTTPPVVIATLSGVNYFKLLSLFMCNNPAASADLPALEQFQEIGFAPCSAFNPSPLIALAVNAAPRIALIDMNNAVPQLGTEKNGWRLVLHDIGDYGIDYLTRGAVAVAGFGANKPEDAFYPSSLTSGDGQQLNGATTSYVIHFATKAELPVAAGFWSITLYDKNNLLFLNPADKYAVHGNDPFNVNPDGSVDIYLQQSKPSNAAQVPNWLPMPSDVFSLTLRIYGPDSEEISGTWAPPPITPAVPVP